MGVSLPSFHRVAPSLLESDAAAAATDDDDDEMDIFLFQCFSLAIDGGLHLDMNDRNKYDGKQ